MGTASAVSQANVQPPVSHGTRAMAHTPRSQVRPGLVRPDTEWEFGLPDQGLASQNGPCNHYLSARHSTNCLSASGWRLAKLGAVKTDAD